MSNPVKVVLDADAIVALANVNDSSSKRALKISEFLNSSGALFLYPATSIIEAVTVVQRKLNDLALAVKLAYTFTNPNYKIIEINQEIYENAVNNYFSKVTNKKDTLFDCIVASIAEKYEADYIFSFDKFYTRLGFKLASEK